MTEAKEFEFIPVREAQRMAGFQSKDSFRVFLWRHNTRHGDTEPIYRRRGVVDKITLARALRRGIEERGVRK